MKQSSKYFALAAAFIVGIGSAIGFQVHAQSTPVAAPSVAQATTVSAVQTTQQDPKNIDGETADDNTSVQSSQQDPTNADGETADDAIAKAGSKASVAAETENDASDATEVEDGK